MSWISTSQTQALVSQISIRLLLSHTSGLPVHGFDGYSNTAIPSVQQILHGDPPANNEQISLFTLPGVGFYYSGGGFTAIQLILGTHLKKPSHQIMDETVLQPLNMTRSTYNTLDTAEKNYAPAYLTGKNNQIQSITSTRKKQRPHSGPHVRTSGKQCSLYRSLSKQKIS
jgi:CubicO group peptidase (beta-lactamase class C family)